MNDSGDSAQVHQSLPLPGDTHPPLPIHVGQSVAQARRILVLATLQHCGNHKTRTAAMLGISLKTLYNHLNSYQDTRSG